MINLPSSPPVTAVPSFSTQWIELSTVIMDSFPSWRWILKNNCLSPVIWWLQLEPTIQTFLKFLVVGLPEYVAYTMQISSIHRIRYDRVSAIYLFPSTWLENLFKKFSSFPHRSIWIFFLSPMEHPLRPSLFLGQPSICLDLKLCFLRAKNVLPESVWNLTPPIWMASDFCEARIFSNSSKKGFVAHP